jgi:D-sedoheptulose 7-phosphate isomerase
MMTAAQGSLLGTEPTNLLINEYFYLLACVPQDVVVTLRDEQRITLPNAFDRILHLARGAHTQDNRMLFIGNGGSAAIASHIAVDFTKNGIRALSFNDSVALTCLGNDFGYAEVFARQLEYHGRAGDLLVAISSSGESDNILRAVRVARQLDCAIVTFSGFSPQNTLRSLGDINLYIPFEKYGLVELAHFSLCHALLEVAMQQPTHNVSDFAPF